MGKMATHEFAIGGPSFDLAVATGRQPVGRRTLSRRFVIGLRRRAGVWHPARSPGTDTGGSVATRLDVQHRRH